MTDTITEPTASASPASPASSASTPTNSSGGTPPAYRKPPYTIYKPNSRGNGGAISFSLNPAKGAVFVEAANQSGERQFDWEHKIIMKWGLPDLGAILAGLQGKEDQTKLFHQTEKANSAVSLNRRENPDSSGAPYLLAISRQNAQDKEVSKVTISLSHAEAAILETALRAAINRVVGW